MGRIPDDRVSRVSLSFEISVSQDKSRSVLHSFDKVSRSAKGEWL